jgi:hypothetical protein
MAEARARRGDADKAPEIELLARGREQLEREVQEGGRTEHGAAWRGGKGGLI